MWLDSREISISRRASCAEGKSSPAGLEGEVMNKKFAKLLTVAALSAALVGVGGAAIAGTSYSSFSTTAPVGQFPGNTGSQTKSTTGASGNVSITSVGSTYKTDATMCSALGVYCNAGTKVYNLNDGNSSSLPNTYSGGTSGMVTSFQISTWNAAAVSISGTWRSN